jgi:uncharacterized RDD family membrane protein YckC
MTQIPAGWYPDPASEQSDVPPGHRYWDGQQWTEHVSRPGDFATPSYAGPAGSPYGRKTTPDGQPLAGWLSRVGAATIDFFVLLPVVILVGWPFWADVVGAYRDLVDESLAAARNGVAAPDQSRFTDSLAAPLLGIGAVSLLVNFVYNVGFLRWKQATPGKLAVGLRVRRRDTPGTLPWSTILVRWATQAWPGFLGAVPVLGTVVAVWPWLDCLWPLWDSKNQALHDKTARTNVVVHRR